MAPADRAKVGDNSDAVSASPFLSQHWVGRRNSLASPFKIPLVLKQQEDAFSATGVWESEGVFSSISSHPTSKASPS